MKTSSPLLGFNNNVRHRGRLFHIQTEDSGLKHPHVITHLFADGGRILKTIKTSYAEHLADDRWPQLVRELMKDQHKAMFISLRDGEFDALFPDDEGPSGSLPPLSLRAPGPGGASSLPPAGAVVASAVPPPVVGPAEPAVASPRPSVRSGTAAQAAPGTAGPEVAAATPASAAAPARAVAPPSPATRDRASADAVPAASVPAVSVNPALPGPAAPEPAASAPEQAASEPPVSAGPPADSAGARRPSSTASRGRREAPDPFAPPPPGLAVDLSALEQVRAREQAKQDTARTAADSVAHPTGPGAPARYVASRPAAVFATGSPEAGGSIFGDDLINEKSLDEVILSYLSEDLDNSASKK